MVPTRDDCHGLVPEALEQNKAFSSSIANVRERFEAGHWSLVFYKAPVS
jgi:hypothetical protein